jgi:hypothetical protein
MRTAGTLDTQAFIEKGFCLLREAVPRPLAERIRDEASSWEVPEGASGWILHQRTYYDLQALAEVITDRVRAAFDELVGARRWHVAGNWGFPTRLAGPVEAKWHIDGDWFTHHVWSGDQVLTPIFLWSDVGSDDGPTLLAAGSHREVSRLLAEHEPMGIRGDEIASAVHERISADEIVGAVGSAGDVYLCHPHLAHSINPSGSREPRYISNVAVHGFNDLRLDGNASDATPLEAAVVGALE